MNTMAMPPGVMAMAAATATAMTADLGRFLTKMTGMDEARDNDPPGVPQFTGASDDVSDDALSFNAEPPATFDPPGAAALNVSKCCTDCGCDMTAMTDEAMRDDGGSGGLDHEAMMATMGSGGAVDAATTMAWADSS